MKDLKQKAKLHLTPFHPAGELNVMRNNFNKTRGKNV